MDEIKNFFKKHGNSKNFLFVAFFSLVISILIGGAMYFFIAEPIFSYFLIFVDTVLLKFIFIFTFIGVLIIGFIIMYFIFQFLCDLFSSEEHVNKVKDKWLLWCSVISIALTFITIFLGTILSPLEDAIYYNFFNYVLGLFLYIFVNIAIYFTVKNYKLNQKKK